MRVLFGEILTITCITAQHAIVVADGLLKNALLNGLRLSSSQALRPLLQRCPDGGQNSGPARSLHPVEPKGADHANALLLQAAETVLT